MSLSTNSHHNCDNHHQLGSYNLDHACYELQSGNDYMYTIDLNIMKQFTILLLSDH